MEKIIINSMKKVFLEELEELENELNQIFKNTMLKIKMNLKGKYPKEHLKKKILKMT